MILKLMLLGRQRTIISYTIEKELGIELVGDTKVKIQIDEEEDPWEDIVESSEKQDSEIENSVSEDFIKEDNIVTEDN